jgi:GTP-binding protein
MACFRGATFQLSVVKWSDLPQSDTPEVAMVGRSNAGKSSALNTLAERVRLAFVSKTPGRTQALNFFTLPNGANVVDLPGYGYAKTSKSARLDWGTLLGRYVQEREQLKGIVMLMDIRHPFTDIDLAFLEWYVVANKPLLILLTKCDKLAGSVQRSTLLQLRKAFAHDFPEWAERTHIALFSSLKKTGIKEADAVLMPWLGMPSTPATTTTSATATSI